MNATALAKRALDKTEQTCSTYIDGRLAMAALWRTDSSGYLYQYVVAGKPVTNLVARCTKKALRRFLT